MKKIGYFLPVLIIIILISGQNYTNAQSFKIGAIYLNQSVIGDEILTSAISELDKSKLNYEIVKFDAKGDSKKFTETLKKWDNNEVNCIYVIGNLSAKLASKAIENVPTIAFAVRDPKTLGIIKNLKAPEGKLTAVSNCVNPRKLIRTLRIVDPNAKKIGLICEKVNTNSKEVSEIKEDARGLGLTITTYGIKTYKDGAKSVRILKNALKVEAIITCIDNQVVRATKDIVASAGQLPILSYSSEAIDKGALFGFIASNEEMGKAISDYTVKILKDEVPIEKLPVVFPKEQILKVNIDTLEKVDVKIPDNLLENAQKVKTKLEE